MGPKTRRVIDVINWGRALFIERNVPHARYTIEVLLEHVLGRKRADLYCDYDYRLSPAEWERLKGYVEKRLERRPLWHLVGEVDFFGMRIRVSDRVLIPRPETELLVEWAIEEIRALPRSGVRYAADIGTGSGNIAVALARSVSGLFVYAVDISPDALAAAEANARDNGAEGAISFLRGDALAPLREGARGSLDMIVSNPPYVSDEEWAALPSEVREREPRIALYGGSEGLDVISRIVAGAPACLSPGGVVLLEVGRGQAPRVREMMARSGAYGRIEARRDYAGVERVVVGALRD